MTLEAKLFNDLKIAMKEKNKNKKVVISTLRAALLLTEKEQKRKLSLQEEWQVLQKEIKQTKQSIEEANHAYREDIVENETQKLLFLESYLPVQLSEAEALSRLQAAGIAFPLSMKDAMAQAKELLNGQVNNATIAKLVKQLIT
jgi:uncharacterized protein YqeY